MIGKIFKRNNVGFYNNNYFIIVTKVIITNIEYRIFYRGWDGVSHFDNDVNKEIFYKYFEEI